MNVITPLKFGANINHQTNEQKSTLHFVASGSSIVNLLSKRMAVKSGLTPLMRAWLENNRLDNIKTLLALGANIKRLDNEGKSAFHFAARDSSPEIIEYLFSKRMSVNMTDFSGLTPLMCACLEGGCLNNIKTLFKHGANIKQLDNSGKSALHFAARDSSPEIIEYLLSLGTTVNMTDNKGQVPLMFACMEGGRLDNIKKLLQNDADINLVDNDGKSVLHFAANGSSTEIIKYLISQGMTIFLFNKSSQISLMYACLDNFETIFKRITDI